MLLTKNQTLSNCDLQLHSVLFYERASPHSVWTYQCLASISGKLDIARRGYSNMAGDELGQAANSDA